MAATQSGFQSSVGLDKGVVLLQNSDLFLVPMDWLMEWTVHGGMVGTTINNSNSNSADNF